MPEALQTYVVRVVRETMEAVLVTVDADSTESAHDLALERAQGLPEARWNLLQTEMWTQIDEA